ncbi:2TM domain-containing protein [Salibacterium halotolerans]|uniref:2TM domain-containing protein n=1 Tax=Salibacterium halotolerans TaxID=1884432 RepID=A0A1I5Y1B6_9BACI|nr:2TM domain-containing protein [Salibacterium halotolerans]SFQ37975.1 2TM domain-containing protein [Salibacterium halotolerans]
MSLAKEMGNHKDFFKHLTLFIIVHIIINVLIRMESTPQFFSGIKKSILNGNIWFYHEGTGIFITAIWLAFLIYQGFDVFIIKGKNKKEEHK